MNLEKPSEKYNKSKFYDVSGEKIERKAKFCPKCGPGVFLAEHKDRETCGTCGFTEMKSRAKPEEAKPVTENVQQSEEPKEEEAPTEKEVKEEPEDKKKEEQLI